MASVTFEDFRTGLDRRKSQEVSDLRSLQECKNAYVTTGMAVSKRPGLENLHNATALAATFKGLYIHDRKLVTVTHTTGFVVPPALAGYGIAPPINATLEVLVCENPLDATDTIARVWHISSFNRKLYVVVEYTSGVIRHFFGTLTELKSGTHAPISDVNCPNTKSVAISSSKVFAIGTNATGQAYVKYSATEDPTDWSSPDDASGTLGLPVGLESGDDDDIVAVGTYRGDLLAFMTNNIQLWKTDPDPTQISLDTVIDNAYITFTDSQAPIGQDTVFLNDGGFFAAGQLLYTDRMDTGDIGSQITSVVSPKITADASTNEPVSVHWSALNQYICAIKDEMFVLTASPAAQLQAWSQYVLPTGFAVEDMITFREHCFCKITNAGGSFIYSFNPSKTIDDTYAGGTSAIDVHIQSAYQSLGSQGRWKKIYGMDALFTGTATVQHRWDARTPTEKTTAISLSSDTRPGPMIPVELMTTAISFDITKSDNTAFTLNGLTYYFQPLGEF
jgi:hypothetical protein|tara:strand:+ start:73 stop:1587 length:1515 start_codon:yes stop_codon:yes gene_type:complete